MDRYKPSLGIKFASAGTAACIAEVATIPLDTAKVRLQVQSTTNISSAAKYNGVIRTLLTISREEGAKALYNGLTPGLHRQLVFASIRLGLYDNVKSFYIDLLDENDKNNIYNPHIGLRILAGITTGALGVTAAQPTDVVKIRLQAQTSGSIRYKGTFDAYGKIAKSEGVKGLWKGILPNITRNSLINACELVSYDLIKETLVNRRMMADNIYCHFMSAFGAGFISTCIASPVDVVKTRFMNSEPGKYKGATDCAIQMFRNGGLKTFYRGFVPSFTRLGSWNIIMFISYEKFKNALCHLQAKEHTTNTLNS